MIGITIRKGSLMKTLLFDLDGTLLSMDAKEFEDTYFSSLIQYYSDDEDPKVMGKALMVSVASTIENSDLSKTNEEVFFETFRNCVQPQVYDKVLRTMDHYYGNHFDCVKKITDFTPELVTVTRMLKEKGHKLVLATNPILPRIATNKRIQWAGYDLNDFDHITRFEEYRTCKPNIAYYEEILERLNLNPKDCIMIGNDLQEDGPAKALGMDVWIIEDNLIDRGHPHNVDWRGSRAELIQRLKMFL